MFVQTRLASSGASVVVTTPQEPWSDPNNVTVDDPTMVTIAVSHVDSAGFSLSDVLRSNFTGFTIPASAVLAGLVFSYRRRCIQDVSSEVTTGLLRIAISGTEVGDNKASLDAWSNSPEDASQGSSGDLWSSGVTIADLNGGNVSVDLRAALTPGGDAASAEVNGCYLSVYYNLVQAVISATDG